MSEGKQTITIDNVEYEIDAMGEGQKSLLESILRANNISTEAAARAEAYRIVAQDQLVDLKASLQETTKEG